MERVTSYAAGDGQVLAFEDERVRGEQRVRFETDNVRTRITVELRLRAQGAPRPGAALVAAAPAAAIGWQRSLARFSYELAAERDR